MRAMMLVDYKGKVLAHGRAARFDVDDVHPENGTSMLVSLPRLRMVAYLRLDPSASRASVFAKVNGVLDFPSNYISP